MQAHPKHCLCRHIGIALLIALPVSTGKASTLLGLVLFTTSGVIHLLLARVGCTATAEE